jgi:hypothetical protein
MAVDRALIGSQRRRRLDQSVLKTLVVAFCVVVLYVLGRGTA